MFGAKVNSSDFYYYLFLFNILSIAKCSTEQPNENLPKAEKLTISIDSVQPALPPQIAYYIPDSAVFDLFNRSFMFNSTINRTLQTLRPPPFPTMPPTSTTPPMSIFPNDQWDSMASPQNNFRFITPLVEDKRRLMRSGEDDENNGKEEDTSTASQNYNYNVEYLPAERTNLWRQYENNYPLVEHKLVKNLKPKKKRIKLPSENFYLNFGSGNLRRKLKELKAKHRDEFGSDDHESEAQDTNDEDAPIITMKKAAKKTKKTKMPHNKHTRKPYLTSSYENESIDYPISPKNHKNCSPKTKQQPIDIAEYDDENEMIEAEQIPQHRPRKKPFTIYLTKVHHNDHEQKQALKQKIILKRKKDSDESEFDFVPSRLLSSVRRTEKVVHKKRPSSGRQQKVIAKINESGGHIVYSEDGYEDNDYNHGNEERRAILKHIRKRREAIDEFELLPVPEELKGQELLDHLTSLIHNATHTINVTSEELRNRPFPLYNSTSVTVLESPIRYIEKVNTYNESETDDYYKTKIKKCKNINANDDTFIDSTTSSPQKKRLEGLGDSIDCMKEKLFGENPLNNPIFLEEKVQQPNADTLIDSRVYNDIMQNIGFNKNQRIFSSYGISNNFDLNSIGTLNTKNRPEDLNTNEEYSSSKSVEDSIAEEDKSVSEPKTPTKTPIIINTYNSPQVPILDISKFIPKPYAYSNEDVRYESDFIPITKTTKIPTQSNPTKPSINVQTTVIPFNFNLIRPTTDKFQRNKGVLQIPANVPVPIPLPLLLQQFLQPQNLQRYRGPSNVVIYRQRKPIALIRVGANVVT